MALKIITLAPEQFDPDIHILPTAGELLLAGDKVAITVDGVAFNIIGKEVADGWVIEVSKEGEIVEIAAMGEQQDDGGYYFEKICVISEDD